MSTADHFEPEARSSPRRRSLSVPGNPRKTTRSVSKAFNDRVAEASRRAFAKNERVSSESRKTSLATAQSDYSPRSSRPQQQARKSDDHSLTLTRSQVRLKRKGTAGSMHEEDEDDQDDALEQTTPTPSHSRGDSGESKASAITVCLCQPDPKIPRPRNAFILYRQHNHAAVAAQNPGLSNPEISKIIGQQWKSEPVSVKDEWKQLAEEEKSRHQKQYPDYRYRPKRNERRGSISNSAGGGTDIAAGENRCKKCGGRSIATTSPGSSAPPSRSPTSGTTQFPTMSVDRHFNRLQLGSPKDGRPREGPHGLQINAPASRQRSTDDIDSPVSPEAKRRRYHGPQAPYVQTRGGVGPGTPHGPPPLAARSYLVQGNSRRESLSRPPELYGRSPPTTAAMGPPATPRLVQGIPQSPYQHPNYQRMSMTLPPIQSPQGRSGSNFPLANFEAPSSREPRSIESWVGNYITPMKKLSTLHRIAPPLSDTLNSDSASPTQRGVIVAVEGFSRAAVGELVDYLQSLLTKGDEHDIKVLDGPFVPGWKTKSTIPEMLEVIVEWHKKGKEMVNFISPPVASEKMSEEAAGEKMEDVLSTEIQRRRPIQNSRTPSPREPRERQSSNVDLAARTRVILLKTYSMHACDRYAVTIPISDSYGPIDHWQWMATLWRGIPGADITVLVMEIDPSSQTAAADGAAKNVSGGNGTDGTSSSHQEKDKIGQVDVNESNGLRYLVVWKERGKDFEERALRRVGFELEEWVRSASSADKQR